MNFSFYILGTPEGRYNQYPDDYSVSKLSALQKNIAGTRMVIFRENDLIHYVYSEKIDDNQYIGFCLIFNGIRSTKPKELLALLRSIVEERLLQSGNIIRYKTDGCLTFQVRLFSEARKDYDELKNFINTELEANETKYGLQPLQTVYNGSKSSDSIDNNATNSQILRLTDKHNYVFINDTIGIENSYIHQIVSSIKAKHLEATKEIEDLRKEISILNRKKKQYGYVLLLFFALLIGVFVFVNVRNDLQTTISNNETEIASLNQLVADKDSTILLIKDSLSSAKRYSSRIEAKYQNFKNEIKDQIPILITDIKIGNIHNDYDIETPFGNSIYSSQTFYLSPQITYKGIDTDKNITLYVKLYNSQGLAKGDSSPSGYSYSHEIYVYDNHTEILGGWGRESKGNWSSGDYRFEIWCNNVCLKSKSFKVY